MLMVRLHLSSKIYYKLFEARLPVVKSESSCGLLSLYILFARSYSQLFSIACLKGGESGEEASGLLQHFHLDTGLDQPKCTETDHVDNNIIVRIIETDKPQLGGAIIL